MIWLQSHGYRAIFDRDNQNQNGKAKLMDSTVSIHQNDVLYVLQLMGDYVRAGKTPRSSHHICVRLCKLITSPKVFLLYGNETRQRLEILQGRYRVDHHHVEPQVKGGRSCLEEFQTVVPQYCRLHSVIHGLLTWEHLHPKTFGRQALDQLNHLQRMDRIFLQLLISKGLTREIADEILVFAGRELIDPEMTCFRALPSESDLLSHSIGTEIVPRNDCVWC